MWEVDPETKSKLLTLQKLPPNASCVDCSAPAPQWASPKFGTFICLDCAGIHRGLGVHISFVRSIMMDSFKVNEVKRMEQGGNKAWRDFWDQHADGGAGNKTAWATTSVGDRYNGDVGEEWKERLSAKVEGREYVPVPKVKREKPAVAAVVAASTGNTPRSGTPLGRAAPGVAQARSSSPAIAAGRKEKNEAYFAKLGNENANRSADLHPSQGGKYAGFGGGAQLADQSSASTQEQGIPGVDDFQKDPVAALTKGFGWLSATVGKSVKSVNEGYIQPNMQKLAESELTAQARATAASLATNVATNVQKGTKSATEQFNRFVEGDGPAGARAVEPEKKDFWDTFGAPAPGASVGPLSQPPATRRGGAGGGGGGGAVGTTAMKRAGAGAGAGAGGEGKREDEWGEW